MDEMIDNNGVGLALHSEGDGPGVLFVHGVGSAQVLWHPFIESLGDRYRCWNLDLRGHGASDRAPGGYSRTGYASDVAAALDHIGSSTIAVGHSLGGVSISRVGAASHPNLKAAYLLDSAPFPPIGGRSTSASLFERQLAMLQKFQPEQRPLDDYVEVLAAAPYVAGGTLGEAMLPAQLRGRAESLSQLDPECFEAIIGGYPDAASVEPSLTIPLRVLTADPDLKAAFRPEFIDRLLALTPHAEIRTIAGVGHQMFMMQGFDSIILDDLESHLARWTT